jgi:hypothetical protein
MADPGISPSEMEAVLRTEQAERELRAALAENRRLQASMAAQEGALRTCAAVLKPYARQAEQPTGSGRNVLPERLKPWTRRG